MNLSKVTKRTLSSLLLIPISFVFSFSSFALGGTPKWEKNSVYTLGDRVIYNSYIYEAKWWNQGNTPSTCKNDNSPWKAITQPAGTQPWESKCVYEFHEKVTFKSYIYEAKWRTLGDSPSSCVNDDGPWKAITFPRGPQDWNSKCIYNTNDTVIYKFIIYKAKWWTKDDIPSNGGPWEKLK